MVKSVLMPWPETVPVPYAKWIRFFLPLPILALLANAVALVLQLLGY